ncbi:MULTISPECIES: hypothetical protein [unclassified Thioalkalivibrio]|uniref:hypothetical protein n=1 Tax=unclassified Thioalkalivibrio TaxID=2621013 RepID=UPI00035F1FF7|nr:MULTISPECIES: hypothetical protein [unclassified Thioalkalivibrio]
MFSTYRKALALLTPKEKRRGGLVLGMVIIMAVLETAGVASVMPFLSVLGNPVVVQTNPVLNTVYEGLGFTSVDAFILALGAAAFGLILFAAFFRSLTHYAMNRFVVARWHRFGDRLLRGSGGTGPLAAFRPGRPAFFQEAGRRPHLTLTTQPQERVNDCR